MLVIRGTTLLGVMLIFALISQVLAADQKVTLALGGKFCDLYPDEIKTALKKVPGVTEVDLKSMKGYAVVTGDSSKMKPEQLVTAVNGVKGDGWHCKADLKK